MSSDTLSRIKALYYGATARSIGKDLQEAIALLKTLETEEERERAAVFMDGLAQMRSEWAVERPNAPAVRPARDRRLR